MPLGARLMVWPFVVRAEPPAERIWEPTTRGEPEDTVYIALPMVMVAPAGCVACSVKDCVVPSTTMPAGARLIVWPFAVIAGPPALRVWEPMTMGTPAVAVYVLPPAEKVAMDASAALAKDAIAPLTTTPAKPTLMIWPFSVMAGPPALRVSEPMTKGEPAVAVYVLLPAVKVAIPGLAGLV